MASLFATKPPEDHPGQYHNNVGASTPPTLQMQQGGGYGGDYAPVGQNDGSPTMAGAMGAIGTTVTVASASWFSLMCLFGATGISVAAFIGGAESFWNFHLIDFLNLTYIFIFGLVLAVLDTPMLATLKGVRDMQWNIAKYVNILTRVTGKGIILIYLGCSCLASIYSNLSGPLTRFFGIVLNLFAVGVGMVALMVGFTKSKRLERSRAFFALSGPELLGRKFRDSAKTYPGPEGGITKKEFNDLVSEGQNGYKWEANDLELIYNALNMKRFAPKDAANRQGEPKLTLEEIKTWIEMSSVML